ncbi:MAG TPA: hypothetical protein VHN15_13850 [Thermoanaerobaculia bacterium]|nr:hypothetical protein [Thermoanaerobaculia bacterium]
MEINPKQVPPALTALVVVALLSSVLGLGIRGGKGATGSTQQQAVVAPAAEEGQAASEEAEKKVESAWKEQRDLYAGFFGPPTAPGPDPARDQAVEEIRRLREQAPGYQLGFLIALVPDPVDSHLANRFDEALDAIQKAYAEAGYLQDRFWIPWKGKPADAPYRQRPGVLLFRKFNGQFGDQSRRELEAVLLVGESPKQGIHKAAFAEAVEIARRLRRDQPVRVLGPTFSGSVESLRLSFRGLLSADPALRFRVTSGSATAENLETFFDRHFGEAVRFSRTVVPDDLLRERAFRFFQQQLGWDLRRVALVVESDTAYGQPFDRQGFRLLWYPSHLGHIRTAWEKGGRRGGQTGTAATGTLPASPLEQDRRPVDLSLVETDDPVDVLPELTPLTTTTGDLALSSLLETIGREQVRYVGIVATDIQDKLFLAEQIRTYSPNVVLFTFDSHLLDTHPQFAAAMDGTLVLTSYPLAATGPEPASRPFTSDFQRGLFQAVRELLPRPPGAQEQERRVWISAVSNGSTWPVASLAPLAPVAEVPSRAPVRESREGQQAKWLAVAAAIGVLAAWLLALAGPLQKAARLAPESWRTGCRAEWFRSWSREAGWVPVLGTAALWLAAGATLAFLSLPEEGLGRKGEITPLSRAFELLVALAYSAAVMLGTALTVGGGRTLLSWKRWAGVAVWGIAAVLLVPVLRALMVRWWVPPGGEDLAFARLGSFTSGLSPLVSLAFLLAGVFTWAIFEVKRRRLIALQQVEWPIRFPSEAPLRECRNLAEEVDHTLERPFAGWKFWVGVAVLFLIPMLRLREGLQPVAEAPAYGWGFLLLVGVGLLLSALSFFRFFAAWRKVERLLDRICHTWLLDQLASGAASFDWKPMKSFGWRMPTFKMTVQSQEKLRQIGRAGLADLSGLLQTMEDELAAAFQAERDGRFLDEVAARRRIFGWLGEVSNELEGLPHQLEAGAKDDSPQKKRSRAIRDFLALRVVAYLRYVFAHLRNCLLGAMLGALLVLMGVTLYAFEPKQFFSFGIWATLLAGTLLTIWVFVQMDRNGALSAIAGTPAGQVRFDRTFLMNVFTYGVVPLVGIVVTQLPVVGRSFSQWVDPLLRVTGLK